MKYKDLDPEKAGESRLSPMGKAADPLILFIPWPSPEISHLFKNPWTLRWEMEFRGHMIDLWIVTVTELPSLLRLFSCQSQEVQISVKKEK